MSATSTSEKVYIPHPSEQDCTLVGILQRLSTAPTNGKKIALILHGAMGHKDYLFQKRLAQRLTMDSFRFDFRGSHESGGTWKQGALEEDVIDLSVVAQYLNTTYGYVVDLVVGHSRGSLAAMNWICTTEEGKKISGFVNVSARYRMHTILDSPHTKIWLTSFAEKGYHDWTVTVAKKPITVRIHPEDLEAFVKWDTSIVTRHFPPAVNVLTIHGLKDTTVVPYEAVLYARALGNRSPGTHVLNFLESADHNYHGCQDEVVDVILTWWAQHQRKELKTGVWDSSVVVKCKL